MTREEAKDKITELAKENFWGCGECLEALEIAIEALEQEPIRPKGHWINKHRLFDSCSAECSSCHKRSNGYMHDNGFGLVSTYYDFCPKCGARMDKE